MRPRASWFVGLLVFLVAHAALAAPTTVVLSVGGIT
jgi:hypothetical protein